MHGVKLWLPIVPGSIFLARLQCCPYATGLLGVLVPDRNQLLDLGDTMLLSMHVCGNRMCAPAWSTRLHLLYEGAGFAC